MDKFSFDCLELINKIIDEGNIRETDFYPSALSMVSSLFKKSFIAICFLEDTNFKFKAAVKDLKDIKDFDYNFLNINDFLNSDEKIILLKTKKDKFLNSNTLIVKLAIKNSVFGFLILSIEDNITDKILNSFTCISNIISYKIKDFELSQVFKLQLKAMQDAVIEKQEACDIIKKQHKKLQQLDKTKNLFLANISHDLRTPLNAIIGFSQALDSKIFGELNDKQAEYVKDIQISGLHLSGMINELLNISKLEAHAMKYTPMEFNSAQAIQEALNILGPLYQAKKIKIKFNKNYEGTIKADYQKFQQILFNLLSNAIKFTNENGKIFITSDNNGKDYILKIQDTGIGIEKKYHAKIFRKFVHLNNVYTKNSTGLGLTITKELVKLHNGKITLNSELNKGTTFTIVFKDMIL